MFSKLKWIDWLYIITTIALLLPIVLYAYGTLIFGDMGVTCEQASIMFFMFLFWIMGPTLFYLCAKS